MRCSIENYTFNQAQGFLVIDGVNGAGKSTLLNRCQDFLNAQGFNLKLTREPGATELGKHIRPLILENQGEPYTPMAEVFLFCADRAEHVKKVIQPAIKDQQIVISDRYYYSTIAFQGHGRGLDVDMLLKVSELAIDKQRPDCVLLLDLPAEIGLRRTASRNSEEKDSFESEALDFHTRIRSGFLDLADRCEEAFFVLDATQTVEHVWSQAEKVLQKWVATLKETRA